VRRSGKPAATRAATSDGRSAPFRKTKLAKVEKETDAKRKADSIPDRIAAVGRATHRYSSQKTNGQSLV
jgi:hypothetical protein